jgi:LytS/YehU family sensor histidine kinase
MLYKQYNDSLKIQKYNTSLADARMRYETEAKEKELELLALKLDKQRYYTYGFAALILLAVIIGYLLFRQSRLNNRRKISEMNRRISEITQANLRQQMNPHFIFNTLNSIQYYMYQHDKIATNNYLTKFSSLMRKILENSQHTFIPIRDELDALKLYLELETLRFKDKFRYHITVDEDVDTFLYKIPTMLLQPYVENSIVHGLVNKEGNGNLNIGIHYHGDFLVCVVEDDGIGREAAQDLKRARAANHNSLGLKITESRVDLTNALYGTQMKITCTDLKNDGGEACGTRVEIQIPVMT